MTAATYLGRARLAGFAPAEGEAAGAFRAAYDDGGWLDVALPCDVHTALVDAGRIPHPYADANERAVAWVAEREWWYRVAFEPGPAPAEGERVRLILHGLDTEVTIWLNGEPLGGHHSMFRPAELDVTELLDHDSPNVLALRFANVVDEGSDVSDVTVRDSLRLRRRKLQAAYGWDISCILLTVGVWQPIELRRERGAALGPVAFSTVHLERDHSSAVVRIGAGVDAFAASGRAIELTYELLAPDGRLVGSGPLPAHVVVERPQLWWTNDLGDPSLYRLTVSLAVDGHVTASREARVGIRTVAVDQSLDPDEPPGRFFRFVLNGRPLFARGANWVPEDLRLGVVPAAAYRERLGQAAAANMNTIRVWGGGSYEQDAFYSACDELGLLIWHDFMFSCLAYRDDPEFLAECEAEARHQVSRLRAHPSLALWCGHNEADAAAGRALFGDVLPRVVADEDGHTPYWPGSPSGGRLDGDAHDWRGFHGTDDGGADRSGTGRHWRRYANGTGRFVSEFGFASAASRTTIEHWLGENDRDPLAHPWQDRIRYVPGDSHVALFEQLTGSPRDADEWIDFSQLIQAEGLRFGIERFRERKPHCSGALLWQLNDCWPGFTWSIVDFDGHPKPAYYAVKRAFAPVVVSIAPREGGQFDLWAVNDSAAELDDAIVLRIQRFDGTVLAEQRLPVSAPPNGPAQLVRRFGWGRILQPRSTFVTVASERGGFAANHQLFADFRELELAPAEPTADAVAADARTVDVTLSTDSFVPMAALEHPQQGLVYDDNYVPLVPGRPRMIRVAHPSEPVDPDLFEARSLYSPADRVPVGALTRS